MIAKREAILSALRAALAEAEADLVAAWSHPDASEVEFEMIEGYRDGLKAAVEIVENLP